MPEPRRRETVVTAEHLRRVLLYVRGVYRHNQTGKWVARIKVGDNRINLGSFLTPDEASQAYEAAAEKASGEYYRKLQ